MLGGVATASPASGVERAWQENGRPVTALRPFDAAMKMFMQERNIPAGQLAVTRHNRLVLARSYAWTDDTVEACRLGPTSLFRIASLSKPVTGVAANVLVQRGDLDLDARLTDLVDMAPVPGETADPRLDQITVRRLLQHLGGWDSDISGDITLEDVAAAEALGASLPVGIDQVVRYGAGRPLDHDPGTTYAYSNYGYMLLGEIVESIAGVPYDLFVQRNVLAPLGITRMRLARTLREHRAPTEVRYFSQRTGSTVMDDSGAQVAAPYGTFRLESRAAIGSWLSSAVDMVRFASLYGTDTVLGFEAKERTFSEPETGHEPGGWYYGLGWFVVPGGTGEPGFRAFHAGLYPGTATYLTRNPDATTFAALFNQSDDPSGLDYQVIIDLLHQAAEQVSNWPDHDLYDEYFPSPWT
ncbi:hypothetical protein GCM10009799_46660 [Nocardiopsis rhodophaea]|uniref:Beta-lactamase-related domain-containing protein n=2 Tax=Nocardiopsis rhodophaea TaxID=280238 RepID=A0ABP5F3W5_9ACTN